MPSEVKRLLLFASSIKRGFFSIVFADCFVRDRRGYKFFDRLVRDLTDARDPQECSDDCKRTSYCKAFAYR